MPPSSKHAPLVDKRAHGAGLYPSPHAKRQTTEHTKELRPEGETQSSEAPKSSSALRETEEIPIPLESAVAAVLLKTIRTGCRSGMPCWLAQSETSSGSEPEYGSHSSPRLKYTRRRLNNTNVFLWRRRTATLDRLLCGVSPLSARPMIVCRLQGTSCAGKHLRWGMGERISQPAKALHFLFCPSRLLFQQRPPPGIFPGCGSWDGNPQTNQASL